MREEKGRKSEIMNVPLSLIEDFPSHPFRVEEDDDMLMLIESIRQNGVLTPLTVRYKTDGKFEIISGHRRKFACVSLGLDTVPVMAIHIGRDEATVIMVDSNSQRTHIRPTDLGKAFLMKSRVMKRLPQKAPDFFGCDEGDGRGQRTRDLIAKSAEFSGRQVSRYIRLTKLEPELQKLVDDGDMKLNQAVEISYLDPVSQKEFYSLVISLGAMPSHQQAIRIKKAYFEGLCSPSFLRSVLEENKPNQKPVFRFSYDKLSTLIPKGYTPAMEEKYVISALKFYKEHLLKEKNTYR